VKLESSDVGRAVCFEWVDPRAIVSTVDPSWGAFNRRQESIWLMLHSLLTTSDLRRILVEEFLVPYLPDVVTLDRVPGPGGALYELGVCGSHRVHTARLLGLPWLLAQTVYHGPPTAARIYRHDVRGADPAASLPGLWAGLQARDLLDGDVERVSPWYTNLTVRHVAAAWLLNRPTRACTINRIYNTVHPGELERAGIPTDVATDPTAWHAWLEHAPSRPADGEPAHGPVRSRARLQRWLTELPGRMLAAGSLLLVGLLVRSALHAVAPRLDGSGGSAVGLATAAWWVALLLAGMTICGPVAAALALSLNEMAAVRWPDRHQRLREYWEAIASLLTPPAIPGQSAAPLAPSDTMLRVSDDGVWKTVHADLRDVRSPLGPVSAGMLRYRLWDFGAGHVEGEIGKCEEYPPRTGAAMLLLAELHRRHPDVRQWWISPLTRHPATRWRQAAAAHGFAYSPHTLLERRRELGIPYLSVMVWGAGDEHIVLDPDLAEADLELHADQAAYRTLAAQLTPDWAAEHARGASTWLHVYRVWDFDRFTDTARWAYGRAAGMHVLSQADSAGNRPS